MRTIDNDFLEGTLTLASSKVNGAISVPERRKSGNNRVPEIINTEQFTTSYNQERSNHSDDNSRIPFPFLELKYSSINTIGARRWHVRFNIQLTASH